MPVSNDKVAFITGVARGQGRAHAVRLAREGMDIIGIDICADVASMSHSNATTEDLEETVRLVEQTGRRMVGLKSDVRDFDALSAAFEQGLAEFGRVDIIIANAGIIRFGPETADFRDEWKDVIDTNLTGVYHTMRAAIPAMRAGKRGGSVVITSSTAGLQNPGALLAGTDAYAAAKRGLVALMQGLATELAPEWIRVNTIHPCGVATKMIQNEAMGALMAQAAEGGTNMISAMQNALPIALIEAEDVANAVAFLVSDEAKFITGTQWPLDAGYMLR